MKSSTETIDPKRVVWKMDRELPSSATLLIDSEEPKCW